MERHCTWAFNKSPGFDAKWRYNCYNPQLVAPCQCCKNSVALVPIATARHNLSDFHMEQQPSQIELYRTSFRRTTIHRLQRHVRPSWNLSAQSRSLRSITLQATCTFRPVSLPASNHIRPTASFRQDVFTTCYVWHAMTLWFTRMTTI
jgi:hypothetical protein